MWILALLPACRSSPVAVVPSPVWDGHERVVLGTGEGCTILAMHGRGDSPDRFRKLYEGIPMNATVIVPQAPAKLRHRAYSWFASSSSVSSDELGAQIDAQADRLVGALPTLGDLPDRLVVTGFSQGGMLSFALAAQHGTQIEAALPVGGLLPPILNPKSSGPTHITAFHGDIDQIVPLSGARESVEAFTETGWRAELRTYPGVAHQIPKPMRTDYVNALKEACEP